MGGGVPRIGVMQGRLTPRSAGRLQSFPWTDWQREFETARALGFACLEWLVEADGLERNPLGSPAGRRQIRETSQATGLPVSSVCLPWLIAQPLAGVPAARRAAAVDRLRDTLAAAAEIGAGRVVVPLVEQAHLATARLEDEAVACLDRCLDEANRCDVALALELDLPGADQARVCRRLGHPQVRVCYDAGNATSHGRDVATDVEPVLPLLDEVHVKDRRRGGSSVRLGDGDANFAGLFATLAAGGFAGDLILEHWFDRPEADARRALEFVRTRALPSRPPRRPAG